MKNCDFPPVFVPNISATANILKYNIQENIAYIGCEKGNHVSMEINVGIKFSCLFKVI